MLHAVIVTALPIQLLGNFRSLPLRRGGGTGRASGDVSSASIADRKGPSTKAAFLKSLLLSLDSQRQLPDCHRTVAIKVVLQRQLGPLASAARANASTVAQKLNASPVVS
jgi:hypothetical protein